MKSLSGKKLGRLLKRHGWILARVRGSHHIYVHPDRTHILTVPVHGNRSLKKGLLATLLKQAGLTEADLDR